MSDAAPLVEMRDISKTFGGVHAVERVSIALGAGEVVGLLGHNGAGKSTLIKILAGVLAADSGEIRIDGQPVAIRSPRDARALGIETIYQNLALTDNLDAVANLFLGREVTGRLGFLHEEAMEHSAQATMGRMKLRLPSLHALVNALSGGQRQAVAIARAIHFNARVLIMDEPTAALGPEETRKVGALIRELAGQGIGIFLISHDIHDVFDLADRLTVMKNGRLVGSCRTADVSKDEVLGMIIAGDLPPGDARRLMRIDAHIHFWRLARGDNVALEPWMGPLLQDHEPAELKPQLDACGIERIVVVQAAETLAESLYTLGLAARTPWIAGVVGWIDLASPAFEEELAALAATGKLLGFRPVKDDNRSIAWLLDARLRPGLDRLAELGLTLDILVQNPDELPLATHLAARHPELTIVLDHCGKPGIRNERFQPWAGDLARLASHANVACKLSGLANLTVPGAEAETLRPYAEQVLAQFGPQRTLWASDWPPLLLSTDYATWWETTADLLSGLGAADLEAVLGGTAATVYRLGGNAPPSRS